ncbi:glycerol kinase GlpK [Pedococcus sp. 5OH_020]|uniref:glycerol kinase GlpK n=1 Tax=Pedococcus sp. 5OH_020 TaxID=2989814 RepID=UPI0022E9E71A|nr:glycerol kinase GlpK [Pedococcus sp. 5OH_020]
MAEQFVLSIDQGTTSTRAILFDRQGRVAGLAQREHRQFYPRPGWVEHDAEAIWRNTVRVVGEALQDNGIGIRQVVALGVANQRETCLLWERASGKPVTRAIVWQDVRTADSVRRLLQEPGAEWFLERCGIPPATYFTAPRLAWLLRTYPDLRRRAEAGELLFGTMETWLVWNLTGGPASGVHVSDVTNASRTMLMSLTTFSWDAELLDFFAIPAAILPTIVPSSGVVGTATTVLPGVPVAGLVGDQQGALFGQTCFGPGEAKCTYGTGAFLLLNTGTQLVRSTHGLLSTIAYQLSDGTVAYALEGSIATAGSLVQWLRDSLGLISSAPQVETLAMTVRDNGGCYIVPAFAGLLAPHWSPEARGVITGLTSYVRSGHLARAVLESTAWQTADVLKAMDQDSGIPLETLRADGGMTSNQMLMQTLADVLDLTVVRPMVSETVSLGAAYLAGLAVRFWPDLEGLRRNWHRAGQWEPVMDAATRAQGATMWQAALRRALDQP